MIFIKFNNLKSITSHLLVKDTFCSWLLAEGQIYTHSLFTINGTTNPDFITDSIKDTQQELSAADKYNPWQLVRPVCYEIIKGKHLPTFFKFIFKLPSCKIKDVINNVQDIKENDIDGLFINIKYEKGILSLTTGVSLRIFTPDKSVDTEFDKYVLNIMDTNDIEYTIL